MKKTLVISAIFAALLTACDSGVINTLEGNAIKFDNSFVESTTRANDITKDNLSEFIVYGWTTSNVDASNTVNIFDKTTVTRNENDWTYNGVQYWLANRRFDFVAYAPADVNCTVVAEANDTTFMFDNQAALAQKDLIVAKYTRTTGEQLSLVHEPISFTFGHKLSRVSVVFENDFTNGSVIEIINPAISNIDAVAKYSYTTNAWSNHSGTMNFSINFPNPQKPNQPSNIGSATADSALVANHFYMIPNAKSNLEVTFTAKVLQDDILVGTYQHTTALPDFNFEIGKSYRVKAVLDHTNVNPAAELKPVSFTIDVMPWGEDQDSNVGFPGAE